MHLPEVLQHLGPCVLQQVRLALQRQQRDVRNAWRNLRRTERPLDSAGVGRDLLWVIISGSADRKKRNRQKMIFFNCSITTQARAADYHNDILGLPRATECSLQTGEAKPNMCNSIRNERKKKHQSSTLGILSSGTVKGIKNIFLTSTQSHETLSLLHSYTLNSAQLTDFTVDEPKNPPQVHSLWPLSPIHYAVWQSSPPG